MALDVLLSRDQVRLHHDQDIPQGCGDAMHVLMERGIGHIQIVAVRKPEDRNRKRNQHPQVEIPVIRRHGAFRCIHGIPLPSACPREMKTGKTSPKQRRIAGEEASGANGANGDDGVEASGAASRFEPKGGMDPRTGEMGNLPRSIEAAAQAPGATAPGPVPPSPARSRLPWMARRRSGSRRRQRSPPPRPPCGHIGVPRGSRSSGRW